MLNKSNYHIIRIIKINKINLFFLLINLIFFNHKMLLKKYIKGRNLLNVEFLSYNCLKIVKNIIYKKVINKLYEK